MKQCAIIGGLIEARRSFEYVFIADACTIARSNYVEREKFHAGGQTDRETGEMRNAFRARRTFHRGS